MKQLILSLSFSVLCLCLGFGQRSYLNANLALGFPASDFAYQNDAVGIGFSANYFLSILPTTDALQVGFGGGYMEYGRTQNDEIIDINISQGGFIIDRIRIPMEIRSTNSILHGQAMVRVVADNPFFKPYIQGAVGFRRLSTDTRVFDRSDNGFFQESDEDDLITSINNLSDWIFTYGGGGGLLFEFDSGVGIHAGVQYMLGGEAAFFDASDTEQWEISFTGNGVFDPDNIDGDDLNISTSPRSARINLVFVEIGVHVNFARTQSVYQERSNRF
ncbi:MAG: hypothetical protein HRU40_16070 [Saprospiraceae bacterium]|nr:hypothetical protein [Saprospiraceae bacterium]